ncbi:hypothetical protein C9J27_04010 [Photobacterium kishitanii]|uniref:Uncharacterized protein n=1 Tax=Photobacterium kishitanii TaxID=318456 RepID=A0A2T3KN45_9GAMM|nr:hypothetical protein C9J27_04010 [Photobacterium kishitanii]
MFKNVRDWTISSQAPKSIDMGAGSTTIEKTVYAQELSRVQAEANAAWKRKVPKSKKFGYGNDIVSTCK